MAFKDWSETASDNDDADASINWAEGQAPSTVNGSARAMMATLKKAFGDFISVKDHGAIGDGSADDTTAIQAALDAVKTSGGVLFFPQGIYLVTSRLTLQNVSSPTSPSKGKSILLKGPSGRSNPFRTGGSFGAAILARTGGIALDLAGSSGIEIDGVDIYGQGSGASTIGIYICRTTSSQFCEYLTLKNMTISMASDSAENGGVGSVALVNRRGEIHTYEHVNFVADTPVLLLGAGQLSTIASPDEPEDAPAGGSHSINFFRECSLLPITYEAWRLYSCTQITFENNYWRAVDGEDGGYAFAVAMLKISGTNIEAASGTPTCAIRVAEVCEGWDIAIASGVSGGMPGVVLDKNLINSTLRFYNHWGLVVDRTATGGLRSSMVFYRTDDGHSVDSDLGPGVLLYDFPASGNTGVLLDGFPLMSGGVSADRGDSSVTLTVRSSDPTQLFNTALAANRAVTLSTTNAFDGARFRIVRTANATGSFSLLVGTGPLKSLTAAGQWCEVEYNGSAWFLSAYGSL